MVSNRRGEEPTRLALNRRIIMIILYHVIPDYTRIVFIIIFRY